MIFTYLIVLFLSEIHTNLQAVYKLTSLTTQILTLKTLRTTIAHSRFNNLQTKVALT